MTPRKPIQFRNAITEMWNRDASMTEMILVLGISEHRINVCLGAARLGYNTPEDARDTAALKAARKAAK